MFEDSDTSPVSPDVGERMETVEYVRVRFAWLPVRTSDAGWTWLCHVYETAWITMDRGFLTHVQVVETTRCPPWLILRK